MTVELAPTTTVVMIFLNGARFMDEAIRSVEAQTHTDWELLLVDDGSTDDSTEIAKRWAEKDDRIRYLEHPGHENRGMSASRNLGLAHARGSYVAFIDCDDVWLPAHLERSVEILAADPTLDATYSSHRIWHSWTGSPEDIRRDRVAPIGVAPDTVHEPGTLLALHRTRTGTVPAIHAIVARRTSLEAVGGFAEEFRDCFEDQVFFTKLGTFWKVFVSGACDVLYRQHPESCCAVALRDGRWHPEMPSPAERRFFEWLERFLDEHGVEGSLRDDVGRRLHVYRHPLSAAAFRLRARRLRVAAGAMKQRLSASIA